MNFEWDEAKRRRNIRERKIDFMDIVPLFDGPTFEIIDERTNYSEIRIICFGELNNRLYVVVYTWRGPNRRIISARKSNAREQRAYYGRNA